MDKVTLQPGDVCILRDHHHEDHQWNGERVELLNFNPQTKTWIVRPLDTAGGLREWVRDGLVGVWDDYISEIDIFLTACLKATRETGRGGSCQGKARAE